MPVKFSLTGDHGLNILAAGYPKVEFVACEQASADAIESTTTAGTSSLTYDTTTDRYTYTWKTSRSWANRCATLRLTFIDGSTQEAAFRFTR